MRQTLAVLTAMKIRFPGKTEEEAEAVLDEVSACATCVACTENRSGKQIKSTFAWDRERGRRERNNKETSCPMERHNGTHVTCSYGDVYRK